MEVVGKTGTTNQARGPVCREPIRRLIRCWVGFDAGKALVKESGGKTAVPIVKAYVAAAEMDGSCPAASS